MQQTTLKTSCQKCKENLNNWDFIHNIELKALCQKDKLLLLRQHASVGGEGLTHSKYVDFLKEVTNGRTAIVK